MLPPAGANMTQQPPMSFWGRPFCRAHRSKTINPVKHFAKVADRSEKNSTRAHKLVWKWWDLLSCFPHVQLMSWHESLRSGHCRHFYFLRTSECVGWWTVIFQIKKISCSDVTVASSGHIFLLKPVQTQPWTLSFDSLLKCGGNELINEFYSFWEENVLSRKKNTNIFKKYFNISVIVISEGRRCCCWYSLLFSSVVKLYFNPAWAD